MKKTTIIAAVLTALALGGTLRAQTLAPGHGDPPTPEMPRITAVEIAAWPGRSATVGFTPTHLTAPRGDSRLFVVEKRGVIWIIKNGQVLPEPFLDIASLVSPAGATINNEAGMHGMVFHPNYAENGKFYVFHTATGTNPRFLRQYTVSADNPDRANVDSGAVLIAFTGTGSIHNGGSLAFGPDGYLYISTGDGGSGTPGVRAVLAQNPNSLYSKLLRIDVNQTSEGRPYAIPPGNMYAAGEGVPEAFATGLRNTFGIHFDGDWLYMGDTGENSWEEINALNVRTGVGTNFGWGIAEGAGCYAAGVTVRRTPANQTCNLAGLTPPVFEYVRQNSPNPCAAIGGVVYRGSAIPGLQGQYFFGDYCSGLIRSFQLVDGIATQVTYWNEMIAPGYRFGLGRNVGFGVDGFGEMYVLTTTALPTAGLSPNQPNPAVGRVWKIVAAGPDIPPVSHVEWTGATPPPPMDSPPWERDAPPRAAQP